MQPNNSEYPQWLISPATCQHLSRYNTSFTMTWRRGSCKCVVQFIHSVFIERGFLHLFVYKAPFFSSWSPCLKLAPINCLNIRLTWKWSLAYPKTRNNFDLRLLSCLASLLSKPIKELNCHPHNNPFYHWHCTI